MRNSRKKLHYGIIGCGHSAQGHAKSLVKNQRSSLTAIFDVDFMRAKKMAAQYHCEVKVALEDMFADPNIDALIICTPHDTHKELALKTIASGKYCIIEKPLGLNSKECQEILLSKYYKNNIFLAYQTRFNTAMQFVFDAISSGALGTLRFCSASVRKNRDDEYFKNSWHGDKSRVGGMLFNQGAHAIDLMMKFCGEPEKISGIAKRFRNVTELEDLYVATIEFKNGVVGTLEVTTYARPKNLGSSIFIIGDNGSVMVGGIAFDRIEYANFSKDKTIPEISLRKSGHRNFLESINDFILKNQKHPLLALAEDGAKAIAFTEKLYLNVIIDK
jgi:predicted dehydrogenase